MDMVNMVDVEIDKKLDLLKAYPNLYSMADYHMKKRGSRLIVKIAGAICEALGVDAGMMAEAVAWIELFHNFTLVHDDIIDQDMIRRGQDAVWKKWGVNKAILAGDSILALVALGQDCFKGCLLERELRTYILTVMEGEYRDVLYEERVDVRIEEYMEMISMKSAETIAFLLRTIGILAGLDVTTAKNLACLGDGIGLSLQIKNDVKNIMEVFQGGASSDIRQKKKTLPILYALKNTRQDIVADAWKEYTENAGNDVGKAAEWIVRNNGIAYAVKKADEYKEEAMRMVEEIKENVISSRNKSILIDKIRNDFYLCEDCGSSACTVPSAVWHQSH